MSDAADLLAALDIERLDVATLGENTFRAAHLDQDHGVVFGGQLLAQSIIAATRVVPDMELLSLHTVFSRGGDFAQPLDITVEILQSGRSMSSVAVTTRCSGMW